MKILGAIVLVFAVGLVGALVWIRAGIWLQSDSGLGRRVHDAFAAPRAPVTLRGLT